MTTKRSQSSNSIKTNSSVRTSKALPTKQPAQTQDNNTKPSLDFRGCEVLTGNGRCYGIGGVRSPTERKP
jgi:hypothetical protein